MVDLIEKLYMTLEHGAKEDEQGLLDEFLQRISHHPQSLHGVLGSDQEVWEMLVVYALERRFGWSENSGPVIGISGQNGHAHEDELALAEKAKKKLNESLDLLLLLMKKEPLSSPALPALSKAAPASHKPVVRQRAYLHAFDWVKRRSTDQNLEESINEVLGTLQQVVVLGLTDVWSATRKSSAEKLMGLAALLSLRQLESLFVRILDRYSEESSENCATNWRQKEGCLLGINAMIKQFSVSYQDVEDEGNNDVMLRFGSSKFRCLPDFITGRLKGLLFHALAHEQVSVRETAAKTFSSYLQRSRIDESMVCLDEVKNKLAGVALMVHEVEEQAERQHRAEWAGAMPSESFVTPQELPLAWKKLTEWSSLGAHMGHDRIVLVEACEAQGLLSLCHDLLKTLPSAHILTQWPFLFPTMNIYLAHSASTVRQACSSLFQCLMAKNDEDSPMLQRLVLQSMATSKAICKSPKKCLQDEKEHRSFSVDEICSPPRRPELWPVGYTDDTDPRNIKQEAPGVGDLAGEVSQQELSSSWEWHEGRLLAYELLLGHLTKQHTTRMFLCDPAASVSSPTKSPAGPHDPARARHLPASTPPHLHQYKGTLSPHSSTPPPSVPNNLPATSAPIMSPFESLAMSPTKMRDSSENSLLDKLSERDCYSSDIRTLEGRIVGNLKFEPLGCVLERIFHEVLHCVGDVRWELRRMAMQVLPLLTVAALWHDVGLLEQLWLHWMSHDTQAYSGKEPPYSYVVALSIREALRRTLEWKDFVQNCVTPLPRGCEVRTINMLDHVVGILPQLLVPIENLVKLKQPLKARALGVELVILIHCRFPDIVFQRQVEQVCAVVQWLGSLSLSAHDDVEQSPKLTHTHDPAYSLDDNSPIMHPSTTPDSGNRRSNQRAAENVERALMKAICPLLPDFVVSCDITQMMQVLPVIVRYMDRYREDLEVELPLVESLHRIFSLPLKCWSCAIKAHDGFKASSRLSPVEEEAARQTSSHVARTVALNVDAVYSAVCAQAHRRAQHYKYLRSGAENGMLPLMPFLSEGVFESACDSCVNALLVLVGAQSTEIVLLRTVFAVLLSIVSLTGDGRYLRCICEALSTRLRTPIMSSPAPSEQSPQHLQIMSNEIAEEQALPMLTQNLHEIEFAAQMESETLFVGNTDSFQRNRARIGDLTVDTTVLGCSLDASDNTCLEQDGGGCDDDESDLDDWSEDEDVSVVEGEVSAFLQSLLEASREWGGSPSCTYVSLAEMLRMQQRDFRGWRAVMASIPSSVRKLVQRLLGSKEL